MLGVQSLFRSAAVANRTVISLVPVSMECSQKQVTLTQVRHAGGGGRPGAKPTLGWQARRDLRLVKKGVKVKKFELKDFGDFDEDIAPFLDEARGDIMLNITDKDFNLADHVGTEEEVAALKARLDKENNPYKQIERSRLFGPVKSAGALIKKENLEGKRFSHKRVFGVEGQQQQQ